MAFYADLHVHSKYSRATSKHCDLENLTYWARRKGITVVGTGDFTHPAWRLELEDKLVPAEPGLWRLRPDLQRAVDERLGSACQGITRFMLSVEISTIYKKGERTRKVHHLLYAPDWPSVDAIIARLSRIGNLRADGRPILGLDSRHLLEITLESGPDSYLVPAHVWTPWFSALGSKSGFDSVVECYADLGNHIFAIETGLSSDPEMNWRLSQLDRYTLVSNSDAHSPQKLGREVNRFECELSYFAMRRALETREGFGGTIEFFPEEGKYHLDGHRKCGVVLEPEITRELAGICPVCKRPLTVGVMHRVQDLADRPSGFRPENASPYVSLIPLPEVISEIAGKGVTSKAVQKDYDEVLARVGDELSVLEHVPVEDIARALSPRLAEAVARMRSGRVIRQPGYDGEYGVIRVFENGELARGGAQTLELPGLAAPSTPPQPSTPSQASAPAQPNAPSTPSTPSTSSSSPAAGDESVDADRSSESRPASSEPGSRYLAALDPEQREAAATVHGPLIIVAGPGTGKTRTLTHRIAHLIADHGAAPETCLAVTFTNRAAAEMRERLAALLPGAGERIPIMTFHALALRMLREHRQAAGLHRGFRIATDAERAELLADALGCTPARARKWLSKISAAKRGGTDHGAAGELGQALAAYRDALDQRALIDFDDVLLLANRLLADEPAARAHYRACFRWISIDEYQDIDELQYQLVRAITDERQNLCAIGDPDQAIYGFRGADVGFFLRFHDDFPGARRVELTRNYRSSDTIVRAALQAIACSSLVPDRRLVARELARGAAHIELAEPASERAEAELLVHTIEDMIGGTSFYSFDTGRVSSAADAPGLAFSDIAVLFRTAAQAEPLREAFARSGIPYQDFTHERLADRPAVARILSAMQASMPGPAPEPDAAEDCVQALRRAVDTLRRSEVAPSPESEPKSEIDTELDTALELLLPVAARHGQDIEAFLAEVACDLDVDAWDPRAERVSLLTMHAAKGLEFRVVFVTGCERGIVPLYFSDTLSDSDLAEERRLFFVALTRAKEILWLTRARSRAWRGSVRETEASPFVADIAEELRRLYRGGVRGRKRARPAEQLGLF